MDLLHRIADHGRVVYAVQQGGDLFEIEGDIFDWYRAGAPIPGGLVSVRVLAPVLPSKIVAVGLNYKDHAAEQGKPLPVEPLIFLKPFDSSDWPRRSHPAAARRGACGPRGRSGNRTVLTTTCWALRA